MKNGDQIRLSQDLIVQEIPTYNYRYQDTKMDTISDLQALLDQIAQETDPSDIVNIYLPPSPTKGSWSSTPVFQFLWLHRRARPHHIHRHRAACG